MYPSCLQAGEVGGIEGPEVPAAHRFAKRTGHVVARQDSAEGSFEPGQRASAREPAERTAELRQQVFEEALFLRQQELLERGRGLAVRQHGGLALDDAQEDHLDQVIEKQLAGAGQLLPFRL